MIFEPKPANDFRLFIATYFERCRAECPKLAAIAGKWTFEDLIPGLSDFDTRFIFSDGVTVEDWMRMSTAVGRVHTSLAKEYPRWARILEHLPGLNLTLAEMRRSPDLLPGSAAVDLLPGRPGCPRGHRGLSRRQAVDSPRRELPPPEVRGVFRPVSPGHRPARQHRPVGEQVSPAQPLHALFHAGRAVGPVPRPATGTARQARRPPRGQGASSPIPRSSTSSSRPSTGTMRSRSITRSPG